MTIKRLIPADSAVAARRQDAAYLARTDHEVIKAMEAVLRKPGASPALTALLDGREMARERLKPQKRAPGKP